MADTSFAFVIAMVKARLQEAAATLKRLKVSRHDFPDSQVTWWPDVVRAASEAYGYDKTHTARSAPSPGAIDRMEEVLGWLLWLDNGYQKLVWARAERITWRQLETADGRSRETLRKEHDAALAVIVERLAERKRA